jgi:hypothetical protein
MTRVITTAGRELEAAGPRTRREVIQRVRQVLRDTNASDEDVDDALETVVELAKSED